VITAIFYHPPPRVNSQGLSRSQVLKEIDYVGGLLSISGMLLFMCGMQWGTCACIHSSQKSGFRPNLSDELRKTEDALVY